MVYLIKVLLFAWMIAALGIADANSAEVEDVRLITEFGKGEIVTGAIIYHGKAYFLVSNDNAKTLTLWKTDGTKENTELVKRIEGESAKDDNIITQKNSTTLSPEKKNEPLLLNDAFYFLTENPSTTTQYLWRSDGTLDGTEKVNAIPQDCWGVNDAFEMNDVLYFLFNVCLWRTDGTGEGTRKVSDAFISAYHPVIYKNQLFFGANDYIHDQELWVSDGTSTGTRIFKDINQEDSYCVASNQLSDAGSHCSSSSYPHDFIIFNNELFFTAYSTKHGDELWKTNGSAVQLVKDFSPGTDDGNPIKTLLNGKLIITAKDGTHGRELWTSDGTAAGTVLLKDILIGPDWGVGDYLGQTNNTLFFAGRTEQGVALWKTDGTFNGTVPVTGYYINSLLPSPFSINVFDGSVYFRAGSALVATDGTASGTKGLLGAMNTRWPSSSGIFNNNLYLSVGDGMYSDQGDIELWATDAKGIRHVKDILPANENGELSSIPHLFLALKNSLLFFARSSTYYGTDTLLFREGLFALTIREITLPWLKPLLLNDL